MHQGKKFYVSLSVCPSDKTDSINSMTPQGYALKKRENLYLLINFLSLITPSSVPCGFVDRTMIMIMITLT